MSHDKNPKQSSIVVSIEHKFFECNGITYTALAFDYEYWRTYLDFFESVVVFARVLPADKLEPSFRRACGPGIAFSPCPYYHGPKQFFCKLPAILVAALSVAYRNDKFLLRSGVVSNILWLLLLIHRKDYGCEFTGDVKSAIRGFSSQVNKKVSVKIEFISAALHFTARMQARRAIACSYVSNATRALYPARSPKSEFVFSSVSLPPIELKKRSHVIGSEVSLITVGRLENEKGHRYLIDAIEILNRCNKEMRFKVLFIGDGTRRDELVAHAKKIGIQADFSGTVTDKNWIYRAVASADVFVLPSLSEGMPRALIEAISLGTPALASSVGGVVEVLEPDFTFLAKDAASMANHINKIVSESAQTRAFNSNNILASVREAYGEKRMKDMKTEFWTCISK